MLKYVRIIKDNPYKLGFIDEESPKDWEPLINNKLSEYKELVHIDSAVKRNNILIILELNPLNNELDNSEYIKNEKKLFETYYKNILDDIKSSKFYDVI